MGDKMNREEHKKKINEDLNNFLFDCGHLDGGKGKDVRKIKELVDKL